MTGHHQPRLEGTAAQRRVGHLTWEGSWGVLEQHDWYSLDTGRATGDTVDSLSSGRGFRKAARELAGTRLAPGQHRTEQEGTGVLSQQGLR